MKESQFFYDKSAGKRWGALGIYIAVILILQFTLGFILGMLGYVGKVENFNTLLIFDIIQLLVFALLFKIYEIKVFNFKAITKKNTLFTVVVFLVVTLLSYIYTYLFKGIEIKNQITLEKLMQNSNIVVVFLSIVVLGPIFEELMFRVVVLNLFGRRWRLLGLLVSTLAFTLVHTPTNLPSFIIYFTMGFGLGLIYYLTDNIELAIFVHMANNFIALMQVF